MCALCLKTFILNKKLLQYERKKILIEHVLHSKAYMVKVWDKIKNIDVIYCKGKKLMTKNNYIYIYWDRKLLEK